MPALAGREQIHEMEAVLRDGASVRLTACRFRRHVIGFYRSWRRAAGLPGFWAQSISRAGDRSPFCCRGCRCIRVVTRTEDEDYQADHAMSRCPRTSSVRPISSAPQKISSSIAARGIVNRCDKPLPFAYNGLIPRTMSC